MSIFKKNDKSPLPPMNVIVAHVSDLNAKVQFIVDQMDSADLLPDHCFTFPDGDTWYATGHEPKPGD